jgi:hypothetical protein
MGGHPLAAMEISTVFVVTRASTGSRSSRNGTE